MEKDAENKLHTLSQFKGQKVILYFYPKASTPGCTTQACDFRDNIASLASHGYQILGISPDAPAALEKFRTENDLNFPLLSDEDHSVAESYCGFDKCDREIPTGQEFCPLSVLERPQ